MCVSAANSCVTMYTKIHPFSTSNSSWNVLHNSYLSDTFKPVKPFKNMFRDKISFFTYANFKLIYNICKKLCNIAPQKEAVYNLYVSHISEENTH